MWHNCTPPPPPCRLARALVLVGTLLGDSECFYLRDRFHFALDRGWSIAISPESAGRFRIEGCHRSQPRFTLWSLDGEDGHLAGAVLQLLETTRDETVESDCLY